MGSSPHGITTEHVWQGEFPNWIAACNAAQAIGGEGLGGDRWFQRITQQLADYRTELQVHGTAMPPRPCNLPLICALTAPRIIVDFGGSSGWCWNYLQASLPGLDVSSYVIIETAEVVEYMKRSGLQDLPVRYECTAKSIQPADLFYCNSVLQYLPSNNPLLHTLELTTPEFILLEDLVATGEQDFYTVQLFHDSAMPYRFLGLGPLLKQLADCGYQTMAKYPYPSPVNGLVTAMPMSNFPKGKQLRYSSSILLKRSSPS